MSNIVPTTRSSRPELTPKNVLSALRVLGFPTDKRSWFTMREDKETLYYDARVAFKAAIKTAHSDVGGTDATARPFIEAFRLIKRYCTRTYVVPRSSEQKRADFYRAI